MISYLQTSKMANFRDNFRDNLLFARFFSSFSSLNRSSKVFPLMFGSQKIPVYCHMGNFGCGDGGWTLAMKIDGNKVQI